MPIKILLIHDFRTVRTMQQHVLAEFSDAAVDWFTSPLDASMILQNNKYDLIMCGMDMSNMNGIAFQKHVAAGINQATPFIIMTSSDSKEQQDLLAQHGIQNILKTPCTSLQLRTTIDKVLNPRSIRAHTRYCIPDARALIAFDDKEVTADIINISISGILCELDSPEPAEKLMLARRMSILFPDEYGKAVARDITPILLKLTVKSWRDDKTIQRVSMVFKFDSLHKDAARIMEQVFEKASMDQI
jgi:CheY-like chemotaxis protein